MAREFKLYKGSDFIKQGTSPLQVTGLETGTIYPEGYFKLSAYDTIYENESAKVDVPEFTTLYTNHLRQLQRSDFTSVNGATMEDEEGGILKITSDGSARIVMNTPTNTNSVLSTPIQQGKTYTLSAQIKLEPGYSGTPSPLNSFKVILSGYSGTGQRLIFTANPIELSTTEYKTMIGVATISADISLITNYYIALSMNDATERFTGTLSLKNIQLVEGTTPLPKQAT